MSKQIRYFFPEHFGKEEKNIFKLRVKDIIKTEDKYKESKLGVLVIESTDTSDEDPEEIKSFREQEGTYYEIVMMTVPELDDPDLYDKLLQRYAVEAASVIANAVLLEIGTDNSKKIDDKVNSLRDFIDNHMVESDVVSPYYVGYVTCEEYLMKITLAASFDYISKDGMYEVDFLVVSIYDILSPDFDSKIRDDEMNQYLDHLNHYRERLEICPFVPLSDFVNKIDTIDEED